MGIRDTLYAISRLPARKPLAWFVTGLCSVTVVVALVRGSDIQSGVRSLLETMLWVCVGGYVASSTGESIWGGGGGYGRGPETPYPRRPWVSGPRSGGGTGMDGMEGGCSGDGEPPFPCGGGDSGAFGGPCGISGDRPLRGDSGSERGGESP